MWHFVFGSLFLLLISGMTKWKGTLKEKLQGQQQFIVPLTKHDVKSLHQGKKAATKHLNTKITTCNNHLTVRNSQVYLQYKYEIIFCDLHCFSWEFETIQANNSTNKNLLSAFLWPLMRNGNLWPWHMIVIHSFTIFSQTKLSILIFLPT